MRVSWVGFAKFGALCWAVLAASISVEGQTDITYELSKIDQGRAWVSSYWGYNAPKLVYDGETFYTLGLWGETQATATGALYGYRDGRWERGYTWDDLNYQPGMLLLDSQQRLVLVYGQINGGPVILRGRERGDMEHFDSIPVPAAINKAGYLGAGIYNDKIVLGYIGDPATYSFNLAVLDLNTMAWDGPHVLAPAQREQEPWTTWLYPIILPDANGVHLAVSNQPDPAATYDTILYMYLPYDRLSTPEPEVVAHANPWSGNMAFGEGMWRADDGSIYLTGQFKPEGGENRLHLFRREAQTGTWSGEPISSSQIAAVFQDGGGTLWMTSTYWDALRLYTPKAGGMDWTAVELPGFEEYGLVSSFFLHGIHPGSGSVMPSGPAAVFSAGPHPDYQLWFVHFDTGAGATAVGDVGDAVPSGQNLAQNFPNPFNSQTVIRFDLPAAAKVKLSIYNLQGQKVAVLAQGFQAAGTSQVAWNGLDREGRPLPSGVYFYRLDVDGNMATRKLVLLR